MTKEEIIQAIKAEIEGLKGICTAQIKANPGQAFPFVMEMTGYDKVLSFLPTLESEKPIIPDLEKELARFYLKDLCDSEKDEISEATLHHNFPIMWDDLRDIARHFAQWGYLRAAEKYNEIEYNRQRAEESVPNDIEEAAMKFTTTVKDHNAYTRQFFQEGYEQAEKDLALTWEDMQLIWQLCDTLNSEQPNLCGSKGFYTEVLNRFNKSKEGKK